MDVPFAVKFDSPRQGLVQMEVTGVGAWGRMGVSACRRVGVACSDVAHLSQTFSQPTGLGRLWINLSASLLFVPTEADKSGAPIN
jgi:hypothetical protein